MDKATVYFLFGNHSYNWPRLKTTGDILKLPDNLFFLEVLKKILNKSKKNRYQKIIIIHEMVDILEQRLNEPSLEIKKNFLEVHKNRDSKELDKLKLLLLDNQIVTEALLIEYFHHGVNKFIDNEWDFGFNSYLVEFHKKYPDKVYHYQEPPNIENLMIKFEEDIIIDKIDPFNFMDEQYLDLWVKYWQCNRKQMIIRDTEILKQVTEILKDESNVVIIIPRGAGHARMIDLFEELDIDGNVYLSDQPQGFINHALLYPYHLELSDQMLKANIQLEFLYEKELKMSKSEWMYYGLRYLFNPVKIRRKIIKKILINNKELAAKAYFDPELKY